ncbi:hypothetical protein KQI65_07500 [bacterium]|nr:hypothetical protein [bacterium]
MSYSMSTRVEDGYLRVEVSGIRIEGETTSQAIEVWRAVADLCEEADRTRVLCIIDLHGDFPAGSAYQLSSDPAAFGWKRSYRAAIVDLNEESYQQNIFTVTVAANRGYQVKLFREEESALAWLLDHES